MLTLHLRDVQIQAEIGVNASELDRPQRLVVSLALEVTPPADPTRDDLAAVVDYSRCLAIIADATATRVGLLETLAHRIGEACLQDRRVHAVTITLEKPTVVANAASVGLSWRMVQRTPSTIR